MNTDKLEKELRQAEKEKFAAVKNAEYHERESKKPGISKKEFLEHKASIEYSRNREEVAAMRIEALKVQIEAAKRAEEEKKYLGILKEFDNYMVRDLKALLTSLESLRTSLEAPDLQKSIAQLETDYNQFCPKLREIHALDFRGSTLGLSFFQSLKTRVGHIYEEVGEHQRISALSGPQVAVQKATNIQLWTGLLIGQLTDLLAKIEKRNALNFLDKVKGVLNGE